MTIISEPQIDLDIIAAAAAPQNTSQKVLFVGQMLSGTATPATLIQNIGVAGEENALFGAKSFIAGMIRSARRMNKATQFDALPLADNGAGVQAAGTIVFTGPATADGVLTISIGSKVNHQYELDILSADTATTTGAALAALINADTTAPFTAVAVTGTVTVTCSHKGLLGNKIGILLEGTVAGVGVTVTAFSGGATDPVLTTLFDPIATLRYQTIIYPNTYSKSTLVNFLDARFNTANAVLDGMGITHNTDTYANIISALSALNSKSLGYGANETINETLYKGSSLFELDDEVAAEFGAVRALRLTLGADISQFVIGGNGALDSFGGISLASLPYANTPFPYLPLTPVGKGFSSFEINNIYDVGGFVIGNNIANNGVISGRALTTYKTDSAGNPDVSFKFMNYVDTLSAIREFFFVNLRAQYAQSRLTSGDLVAGRKMANAGTIFASCVGLYALLAGEALVQAGVKALRFYKQNLNVVLDIEIGSATITMQVPIVTQLRNLIGTVQISFQNFGS
jgi:phage tail sheath gpL-like